MAAVVPFSAIALFTILVELGAEGFQIFGGVERRLFEMVQQTLTVSAISNGYWRNTTFIVDNAA